MSGRKIFSMFKWVLVIVAGMFRMFPNPFLRFIWELFSPMNGYFSKSIRYCILKAKAAAVGDNVLIGSHVVFKNWERFRCGSNVSIHEFCHINCVGGIEVGDNVSIAHGSSLVSANHTWEDIDIPIKYNPIVSKGIIIESDVWIGCAVRILDGVHIKQRTVIAAGAVVSRSFDSNVIIGGVPAKLIKTIS